MIIKCVDRYCGVFQVLLQYEALQTWSPLVLYVPLPAKMLPNSSESMLWQCCVAVYWKFIVLQCIGWLSLGYPNAGFSPVEVMEAGR